MKVSVNVGMLCRTIYKTAMDFALPISLILLLLILYMTERNARLELAEERLAILQTAEKSAKALRSMKTQLGTCQLYLKTCEQTLEWEDSCSVTLSKCVLSNAELIRGSR